MSKILSILILLLIGAAFSPDLSSSLENPKKNWSDYTDEEKEDIKAKLLREAQVEEVPFKRWSDYTDSEKRTA